jgi:hypothetical protein
MMRFDLDDALLIGGTACTTVGLWSFDYRIALVVLGLWLVWLGIPRRGGEK